MPQGVAAGKQREERQPGVARAFNMSESRKPSESFARQVSLDRLAWDAKFAASLTADERRRVVKACASILAAVAEETDGALPTRADTDDELATPEQVAQRLRVKLGTLYEKLAPLDERHGVIRIGKKCTRIRWSVFWAKIQAGEIVWRLPVKPET